MGFSENLRKKIEIDRKAARILKEWGPAGSGKRIDRETVRELLEMGSFRSEQTRDLTLYYLEEPGADGKAKILVLDNELPIFDTSTEDVAMRRSPLIKEMVSIKNAIRILNDKDITVSKKEDSLQRLRSRLIEGLDLTFTPDDIERMADDGAASLDKGYDDGVAGSLALFAEMLGFAPAPRAFALPHHDIFGAVEEAPAGEKRFGPLVVYSRIKSKLRLLDEKISSRNASGIEWVEQVAKGNEPATLEGAEVFGWLRKKVLERHPEGRLETA